MEITPTPYQRNRRAGRIEPLEDAPVTPAEQTAPAQQPQQAYPPVQPVTYTAPPSQSATPVPRAYASGLSPAHSRAVPQPRAGYTGTSNAQQSSATSPPRPRMTSTPESRTIPPTARPQASGNPRVIREVVEPGFSHVPRSRYAEPVKKAEKKPAKPRKTPSWLTTLMCLMLVVVMAIVAGSALMQAYLKTAEDKKQAAYERVLYEYHLTEQADGTLRVTWQDIIERYAAEYNLDPAFVTAIIRNESSFNTKAESSVGARGLMQAMPDTAEWIAGKLGESFDFDNLYEAETSIRYGCWYLNYLSELFTGDPVLVCAAYHAGQGEVLSWLGDEDISVDGVHVHIDDIPITNTRNYAKKVTQAYGIYESLLYPQPSADEPGAGAADGAAAAGR